MPPTEALGASLLGTALGSARSQHKLTTMTFSMSVFQGIFTWPFGRLLCPSEAGSYRSAFSPPRTLHFTKAQVFWECVGEHLCETFPEKLPPEIDSCFFITKGPITNRNWQNVVEAYCNSKLTYAKDKLVAISGLARLVQDKTGDQYVAGMWRKYLEIQLCWSVDRPGRRISPYTAPTWSWASIDAYGCRLSYSTIIILRLLHTISKFRTYASHTQIPISLEKY
jgi:hypothetical protein